MRNRPRTTAISFTALAMSLAACSAFVNPMANDTGPDETIGGDTPRDDTPRDETRPDDTVGDETEMTDTPATSGDREDAGGETSVGQLELSGCYGEQMECGDVVVPIDSNDPSLGTLNIAIAIHRAEIPDERIGVLMVNPGGPGGSGIEYAVAVSHGGYPSVITDRFDIVGFDPRGVGDSEPRFTCGDADDWINRLNEIGDIDSDADVELVDETIDSCTDEMGPATNRLGTEYVARDMDVIREALGEETITFYGASYGSTIGGWYASRFPDRVRAMVVDGADNPVDDYSTDEAAIDSSLEETAQLEAKLREALEACATPACPIYNDGDPVGFFLDHTDDLQLVDDEFDGHPDAGFFGVVSNLYDEDSWPDLWQGMADVADGDPQELAESAEFQFQGDYGASITAHVNCLDSWAIEPDTTIEEIDELTDLVEPYRAEQQPLLTSIEPEGPDFCPYYKDDLPDIEPLTFDGGDVPIVVVANQSDPVTPFGESVEMSETLSNAYLVEVDYPAHVAYPEDQCARDIIDEVLITANPPAETTSTCPRFDEAQRDGVGELNNTGILILACYSVVSEDTDPDAANTACQHVIERGEVELADVNLGEAFENEDSSVLNTLYDIIIDEFDAAGIDLAG